MISETNTFNHLQPIFPFVLDHTEIGSLILRQSQGNQKKIDVAVKSNVLMVGGDGR